MSVATGYIPLLEAINLTVTMPNAHQVDEILPGAMILTLNGANGSKKDEPVAETAILATKATNGHTATKQTTIGRKYETLSGASKLQWLLKESDDLIVCPGVYDGFSARIAMSVGFQALYMVCDFSLDLYS